jgi:hypothetical protein
MQIGSLIVNRNTFSSVDPRPGDDGDDFDEVTRWTGTPSIK